MMGLDDENFGDYSVSALQSCWDDSDSELDVFPPEDYKLKSCCDNSDSELDVFPPEDYKLKVIICRDDKEKFVSRINRYKCKYEVVPPKHLKWILKFKAIECFTALLEGETGHKVDFDNTEIDGLPMLYALAESCNAALIELSIRHGASFNHRAYGLTQMHAEYEGKLPLNIAVELRASSRFHYGWNPCKPLFEMLVETCVVMQKMVGDSIRMLLLNTKDADLEICRYAKAGNVVELAVLLMSARERVAPIVYQIKDGSTSVGGMPFRHYVFRKLATLTFEEFLHTCYSGQKNLLWDYKEMKMSFASTLLLLDIFEKAGDNIEAYIIQERGKMAREQVAIDVSWLLRGAGLLPKYQGVNLNMIWSRPENCLGFIQPTKYAIQAKEMVKRKLLGEEVNHNKEKKPIIGHTTFPDGSRALPLMVRSFHTVRATSSSQSTTFMEAQAKRTTKPRNLSLPKNLSCQQLSSIATAIKMGIRHL